MNLDYLFNPSALVSESLAAQSTCMEAERDDEGDGNTGGWPPSVVVPSVFVGLAFPILLYVILFGRMWLKRTDRNRATGDVYAIANELRCVHFKRYIAHIVDRFYFCGCSKKQAIQIGYFTALVCACVFVWLLTVGLRSTSWCSSRSSRSCPPFLGVKSACWRN